MCIEKKINLLEAIYRIFSNKKIPKKTVRDSSLNWPEYCNISDYFMGKQFDAVTLTSLFNELQVPHDTCLYFMTPEAKAYYLGSYLIISLNDYELSDLIPEALVNLLIHKKYKNGMYDDKTDKEFDILFSLFSQEEKLLISDYLKFMYFSHDELFEMGGIDIDAALEHYQSS